MPDRLSICLTERPRVALTGLCATLLGLAFARQPSVPMVERDSCSWEEVGGARLAGVAGACWGPGASVAVNPVDLLANTCNIQKSRLINKSFLHMAHLSDVGAGGSATFD